MVLEKTHSLQLARQGARKFARVLKLRSGRRWPEPQAWGGTAQPCPRYASSPAPRAQTPGAIPTCR